jgi:hypothetical protein
MLHTPVERACFLTVSKQLDCIALKTPNLNMARYISAMKEKLTNFVWKYAEIKNTHVVLKHGEAVLRVYQVLVRPPNCEGFLL